MRAFIRIQSVLEIDGSDGGGQLLRSSLALAAVTGRSVRVENVRGNRPEPGLKAQHLTAVEVLQAVCNADVDRARWAPRRSRSRRTPQGGTVETAVGTDVKWSPSMATYRQVKLPLCRRFGLNAVVERRRTGFYPAGGGEATLSLTPSSLSPIELTDRGALVGGRVRVPALTDHVDSSIDLLDKFGFDLTVDTSGSTPVIVGE